MVCLECSEGGWVLYLRQSYGWHGRLLKGFQSARRHNIWRKSKFIVLGKKEAIKYKYVQVCTVTLLSLLRKVSNTNKLLDID